MKNNIVLFIILCGSTLLHAGLIENLKESKQEVEEKASEAWDLTQLPKEVGSQIVLFSRVNDIRQAYEAHNNYCLSNSDLYKKEDKSKKNCDTCVWSYAKVVQGLVKGSITQFSLSPSYWAFLYVSINIKMPGLAEQEIIVARKNEQKIIEVIKKLPFIGRSKIVLFKLTDDKQFLFTQEHKKKVIGFHPTVDLEDIFNLIIRKRIENDEYKIIKEIELPNDEKYVALDYFSEFSAVGLLKDDEKTVKFIPLNEDKAILIRQI
ncbi:MAG: hypothetical protein WDZ41_01185 [Candidatus Babeliales bacterium]